MILLKTNKTFLFLFLFIGQIAVAQTDSLRYKIEQIVKSKNATIGIAIHGIEDGDTLSWNGNKHFPMQSVYKYHLAMAVLDLVDKQKLSLEQELLFLKKDLLPNTWSPIREKYPEGNVKLKLSEVIAYMVSQSDNNACDYLFRLIGGPKRAHKYMQKTGIKDIAIVATEEEMHKDWNVQFTNWTTSKAAVDLLKKFHEGVLSEKSTAFLKKVMLETSTGPNRIKGKLPKGIPVAHKTGSSGMNDKGITAACNDIGIVQLPNGKHFAIAVFVSNSFENEQVNEAIIAELTKAVWDYYLMK